MERCCDGVGPLWRKEKVAKIAPKEKGVVESVCRGKYAADGWSGWLPRVGRKRDIVRGMLACVRGDAGRC